MISTMLDTDLYKYTMGCFAYKHGSSVVEYVFKCRNTVDLSGVKDILIEEIKKYLTLTFNSEEVRYLNELTKDEANFLLSFIENPIPISIDDFKIEMVEGELSIRVKGPWWSHIYLEVPILAMVNEIYNNITYTEKQIADFKDEGERRLTEKIKLLNENPNVKIMEFGTRRRFSRTWQEHVLHRLITETKNIIGTSNVALAKKFEINALGTIAHEALQYAQAVAHPLDSQKNMFDAWLGFWGNKHLIALTDIFPQKKFLRDFDARLAKAYDGVRHDSGDPKQWVREIIAHYESLGIDPKTKTAVFSDGLDIPLCIEIHNEFSHLINTVFGVGTNLTNDMGDNHTVLQIVMKIVNVNGRAVAKLSNNPAKSMCEDPLYVTWLNHAINTELEKDGL